MPTERLKKNVLKQFSYENRIILTNINYSYFLYFHIFNQDAENNLKIN